MGQHQYLRPLDQINNRNKAPPIKPTMGDGGVVAVVDYLQVLDQNRAAPELSDQVEMLKGFVAARDVRLVVLSQVHRSYDPAGKALPDWTDVRLPNPVDLSLFDRGCFLHDGKLAVHPGPG